MWTFNINSSRNANAIRTDRQHRRRGSITSEAVTSAAILIVGVVVVARTQISLQRLWNDNRSYQLANDELSNQLQRLTRLPIEQLPGQLASLSVHEQLQLELPDSHLTGQLVQDQLGPRIQLELAWKRAGSAAPLRMVGWLCKKETKP
jgi:hypothetical protein